MEELFEHPLLTKRLISIGSWDDWLVAWNEVAAAEFLGALIDVGLALPHKDPSDAVAFYLNLTDLRLLSAADSKKAEWHGSWPSGLAPVAKSLSVTELRNMLVDRAWVALKKYYFGSLRGDEDRVIALRPVGFGSWGHPVHPTEGGYRLLERLIAYARGGNLRRVSDSDPLIKLFFVSFGEWLLDDRTEYTVDHGNEEGRQWARRIDARRRAAVHNGIGILRDFEQWDVLARIERTADAPFMEALKEMAIDHWGTGRQMYASVEDAFSSGDRLADVYFRRWLREQMPPKEKKKRK